MYKLMDSFVNKVDVVKDLGVICDNELNFRSHIDNMINRASSMLGFVKRWAKEFSNPYVTKILYTSYVRLILEYACQVSYELRIRRIETIQRKFIRFALRGLGWVDSIHLPPYNDRLKLINL